MKKLIFTLLLFLSVSSAQGQPVQVAFSFSDTTTSVIDTASRSVDIVSDTTNSLTRWFYEYKITVYAKDSTIQISHDPTFPANKIIEVVAGASWNSPERYHAGTIRNWYIRKKSTAAGICNYIFIIEGY